ncbi:MAG: DedA family protein [Solirubrobacterales bacterium]|nr:DedA family protein [Solirubrobacterales bacterium]
MVRLPTTLLTLISIPSGLGYPALGGLVAAESMGIPVPGETALIAAGIMAHDGNLQIPLVIAIAAVAAIAGDNAGYLIGRKGGRALLEKPGPLLKHRNAVLTHGEPFFERHGPKAVFLGRWVAGLRIAAAWLAGINRMHWLTFFFWNALGGVAWATSVGLAAYYLGHTAETIIKSAGLVGIGALAVALVAFFLWRRRRAARATESQAGDLDEGRG